MLSIHIFIKTIIRAMSNGGIPIPEISTTKVLEAPISDQEVLEVIKGLHASSTLGPDGLPPIYHYKTSHSSFSQAF